MVHWEIEYVKSTNLGRVRSIQSPTQRKQPTYKPQRNWRLDPLIATAPKHLASRYFQLKSGHAAIGTYLQRIQAREESACQGCGSSEETVHHFLFESRQWRHQKSRLYKDLETDGVMRPTTAEECPQWRLLTQFKATRVLVQSLANTRVALPQGPLQQAVERARKDEEGFKCKDCWCNYWYQPPFKAIWGVVSTAWSIQCQTGLNTINYLPKNWLLSLWWISIET